MTKQEFITEFTLRALTQIQVLEASDEAYYIRTSIRIANDTWAAIQANKDTDVPNLAALAEKALLHLSSGRFISQDRTGGWFVFENEPEVDPTRNVWHYGKEKGRCILFDIGAPPADFTKQCYRISDIFSV